MSDEIHYMLLAGASATQVEQAQGVRPDVPDPVDLELARIDAIQLALWPERSDPRTARVLLQAVALRAQLRSHAAAVQPEPEEEPSRLTAYERLRRVK